MTGVALALVLSGAAPAAPAPAALRLELSRGPGAEACPDEATLRDAVSARLGYVPWAPAAPRSVRVELRSTAGGLAARIALTDEKGVELGTRDLAPTGPGCAELAAAVELAIAIAIDPLAPTSTAAAPSTPPATEAQAARYPTATATVWHVGAGVGAALGAGPGFGPGAVIAAGGRRGGASLWLEVRADLPTSAEVAGGTVEGGLLAGTLAPCLHGGAFAGCVLVAAGVLQAGGRDLADARSVDAPFAALGARFAFEHALSDRFLARATVDVAAHLTRTILTDSATGDPLWSSSPAQVGAALALLAVLP